MTGHRHDSVVIIGASVAGISAAEALRRTGHTGTITFVDSDPHPPYDRPPLSKQYLAGDWDEEHVALRPAPAIAALDANWIRSDADGLDVANREVRVRSGNTIRGDAVLIATGVHARRLSGDSGLAGVHTLRTLQDAQRLRGELQSGTALTVVGNGVLGSEISATAALRGLDTQLVGHSKLPMLGQLGELGASRLAEVHNASGIATLSGRRVAGLASDSGRVIGIVFADGSEHSANTVAIALGSVPATEWLRESHLLLRDGVLCDEHGRAAEGIWAAGDVARWNHPLYRRSVRWENRTNAVEMGAAVARDILGQGTAYAPIPYFWTDQLGIRIQVFGSMNPADHVEVIEGDATAGRFVALAHANSKPTGVLGWGMPKQARIASAQLATALGTSH